MLSYCLVTIMVEVEVEVEVEAETGRAPVSIGDANNK
jgi:hypothetical protein